MNDKRKENGRTGFLRSRRSGREPRRTKEEAEALFRQQFPDFEKNIKTGSSKASHKKKPKKSVQEKTKKLTVEQELAIELQKALQLEEKAKQPKRPVLTLKK